MAGGGGGHCRWIWGQARGVQRGRPGRPEASDGGGDIGQGSERPGAGPGLSRRCVRLQAPGQGTSWTGDSVRGQGQSRCHRAALPTAGCLSLPEGRVQTGTGEPLLTPRESEEGL